MADPGPVDPVLLVLGTLHSDESAWVEAMAAFAEHYGEPTEHLGPLAWHASHYYEEEMGPGLVRHFFIFNHFFHPGDLPDVKLFTNELEARHNRFGHRLVNLDPGYIGRGNVVLATAKNRHQRIYISKGIYGDLTLTYHSGAFQTLPWTYKDWGSTEARTFLARGRKALMKLLNSKETDAQELS